MTKKYLRRSSNQVNGPFLKQINAFVVGLPAQGND